MTQVAVLGTCHDVQGAARWQGRKLGDARYRELLEELLRGRDFVFEEASGLGPTTAQELSARLGAGRYLDVDPHLDSRFVYQIPKDVGEERFIRRADRDGFAYRAEFAQPQGRRERVWLDRIQEKEFAYGLLVCGFLHTLSMSFRLLAAGYVVESFVYMPWDQFCSREHVAVPGY